MTYDWSRVSVKDLQTTSRTTLWGRLQILENVTPDLCLPQRKRNFPKCQVFSFVKWNVGSPQGRKLQFGYTSLRVEWERCRHFPAQLLRNETRRTKGVLLSLTEATFPRNLFFVVINHKNAQKTSKQGITRRVISSPSTAYPTLLVKWNLSTWNGLTRRNSCFECVTQLKLERFACQE